MNKEEYKQFVPQHVQRSSINIVSNYMGGRKSTMYNEISEHISEQGVAILQAVTKSEKRNILSEHFTTTLISFLVVAILAVVIAGFGLATTMSVQVAERTHEIDILKSIGGNYKQVYSNYYCRKYLFLLI